MNIWLRSFKEHLKKVGEKGQGIISFVVGVIVVAIAVYILIILIRYLIIPAITNP